MEKEVLIQCHTKGCEKNKILLSWAMFREFYMNDPDLTDWILDMPRLVCSKCFGEISYEIKER